MRRLRFIMDEEVLAPCWLMLLGLLGLMIHQGILLEQPNFAGAGFLAACAGLLAVSMFDVTLTNWVRRREQCGR